MGVMHCARNETQRSSAFRQIVDPPQAERLVGVVVISFRAAFMMSAAGAGNANGARWRSNTRQ
jgi:hypothetical protein